MGITQPPKGREVAFEPIREGWSTYKTKDEFGATIRLKTTILKFILTDIDDLGNPRYIAGSTPVTLTVSIPPEKKGTPTSRPHTQKEILDSIVDVNLEFDTIKEEWNEYKLEDGITVSVKQIATIISRTNLFDESGDPIYWVQNQAIVKSAITKEDRERFLKLKESMAKKSS